MASILPHVTPPAIESPRLALRPAEAAKALGIGERLLWELTNTGEIPHTRLGRAVIYPTDALREWLKARAEAN